MNSIYLTMLNLIKPNMFRRKKLKLFVFVVVFVVIYLFALLFDSSDTSTDTPIDITSNTMSDTSIDIPINFPYNSPSDSPTDTLNDFLSDFPNDFPTDFPIDTLSDTSSDDRVDNLIDDKKLACYKLNVPLNSINYFADILDAEKKPMPGKTIFFHETSCRANGIADLNAKQACAIESTARWNPDRDIFVIFASPVGLKKNADLPLFIKQLVEYDNIHFRNIDLWRYSMDTPAEQWIKTNKLFQSPFLSSHMSDYLRAVTLYKFGGMYMDLDIVVKKSLTDMGEDFITDDWGDVINGAVMHLNNYGIGREISGRYLARIIKNFNGGDFIGPGPKLLTSICIEICKTENRKLWTREQCQGLKLQPLKTILPISWTDYMMYFDANKKTEALEVVKNSVLIHVWNDRSHGIWNKVNKKNGPINAYQAIAKENCPLVYENSEYF